MATVTLKEFRRNQGNAWCNRCVTFIETPRPIPEGKLATCFECGLADMVPADTAVKLAMLEIVTDV